MEKQKLIKTITRIAVVAAIYATFTIFTTPISFGVVQFRLAEILVLLCFFKKDYCYSLVIGCFIANIFSPDLGIIDCIFGTFHTLVSVIIISKLKNIYLASLVPAVLMFIIAFELKVFIEVPESFMFTYVLLFVEELVVVGIIGIPVFKLLTMSKTFCKVAIE